MYVIRMYMYIVLLRTKCYRIGTPVKLQTVETTQTDLRFWAFAHLDPVTNETPPGYDDDICC